MYRDKIMEVIKAKTLVNTPVKSVKRLADKVEIANGAGQKAQYDYVLLASHADETLKILTDATPLEQEFLSKFPHHLNTGILHTDEKVMPRLKQVWSSWNYRMEKSGDCSTIYWMNNLQGVSSRRNYFVSINDPGLINPNKILWEGSYFHPLYSVASQQAQMELHKINGASRVFFAGAYFRYGFHEDGLWSGLQAARALSGEQLWA